MARLETRWGYRLKEPFWFWEGGEGGHGTKRNGNGITEKEEGRKGGQTEMDGLLSLFFLLFTLFLFFSHSYFSVPVLSRGVSLRDFFLPFL